MKISKYEQVTVSLNLAEVAVIGAGYCAMYPASDMVWFHRQVIDHTIAKQEVLDWLDAVSNVPGYAKSLSPGARHLRAKLDDEISEDARVILTVDS